MVTTSATAAVKVEAGDGHTHNSYKLLPPIFMDGNVHQEES